MTTAEKYIAQAKEIVKDVFLHYPCTYRSINKLRLNENLGSLRIASGGFRLTMIDDNCRFVIKTGLCHAGDVQCRREAEIYKSAIERGLGCYFAKFYGCFRYKNHYFYVFEKINHIGENYKWYTDDMPKYAKKKRLWNFLTINQITDYLHPNSYGRRGRTKVIVDYCGIREEDWIGYTKWR